MHLYEIAVHFGGEWDNAARCCGRNIKFITMQYFAWSGVLLLLFLVPLCTLGQALHCVWWIFVKYIYYPGRSLGHWNFGGAQASGGQSKMLGLVQRGGDK